MNNSPIISTIIPSYNPRINFLEDAIESLLSQSFTNWEAIIVNDGSDSKSTALMRDYIQNLNDKRILLINLDKNYGVSKARNIGIEAAKGEIITFLDCDDILLPWFYEEVITYLSKNSLYSILCTFSVQYFSVFKIKCIYYSHTQAGFLNMEEDPNVLLEKIKSAKKFVMFLPFIKKEVFKLVTFDPELKVGEDRDLFIQIFSKENLTHLITILPTAGALYRIYLSNTRLTSDLASKFYYSEKLINKYKNDKDTYAYKMIQHFEEQHNYFKFSKIFNKYFEKPSVLKFLADIIRENKTLTEKITCIGELTKSIIEHDFLLPLFSFDGRHIRNLLHLKNNKLGMIKKIFVEYLNSNHRNEKSTLYARKIFQKIF